MGDRLRRAVAANKVKLKADEEEALTAPHSTALYEAYTPLFLCWAARPCCFKTQ